MDILTKIKKLAIAHRLRFTMKAECERIEDGLSVTDIVEAIVNAPAILKTLRSTSPSRQNRREKLYVMIGPTYNGTLIYTKGTIRKFQGVEAFYILVSSKRSIL